MQIAMILKILNQVFQHLLIVNLKLQTPKWTKLVYCISLECLCLQLFQAIDLMKHFLEQQAAICCWLSYLVRHKKFWMHYGICAGLECCDQIFVSRERKKNIYWEIFAICILLKPRFHLKLLNAIIGSNNIEHSALMSDLLPYINCNAFQPRT